VKTGGGGKGEEFKLVFYEFQLVQLGPPHKLLLLISLPFADLNVREHSISNNGYFNVLEPSCFEKFP